MGGFYGSVQVRSEDRDRVRQVAEQVARAKKIKCLLGPALRGWVGVYPENGGQDQSFGEQIASVLGGEVLHIIVHDSDVMAYWLWREGSLIDSYWSRPGYFGEADRAEQEAMSGRAEAFVGLPPDTVEELRQVLRRDREEFHVFEEDRLSKFAGLLGIPNAMASYEYLKDGETEEIEGRKQFEELPADDIAKEKESRQLKRAQMAAMKRQIKASGLLLAEMKFKGNPPRVAAAGDGFAVSWVDPHSASAESSFDLYVSPWQVPRKIAVTAPPHTVTSDTAGSRLAAVSGNRVIVLKTADWRVIREVPEEDWAIEAALSADGRLLAHSSRQETVVTDVGSGERVTAVPSESTRGLGLHPSGKWLVTTVSGGTIAIAEVGQRPEERWREFYVAGSVPVPPSLLQQPQIADQAEIARQRRVTMEALMKKAEKMARAAGAKVSDEDVRRMREQMEKALANMADEPQSQQPAGPNRIANEMPMSVMFTHDGRWLCCGTAKAFNVYDWEAVVGATGSDMPAPTWRCDPKECDEYGNARAYIYSIVEESDGTGVLFGGLWGKVRRLDLRSGDTRLLLTMPDEVSIVEMAMSRDGQNLSIVTRPRPDVREQRRRVEENKWSIWSYPMLLARHGPSDRT